MKQRKLLIIKNKKGDQEEFSLDEQVDGVTEDFDLIQMNLLQHEYSTTPSLRKR